MNKLLKDLFFAIAYLDGIIIYSRTAKEHLDHLQQDFHKLCDAELTMILSKCDFSTRKSNIRVISSAELASNNYLPRQQLSP